MHGSEKGSGIHILHEFLPMIEDEFGADIRRWNINQMGEKLNKTLSIIATEGSGTT